MKLCDADLRCLDAHAHLGNLEFDHSPKKAIRHYEAGLRIGELSLPRGFDGVLTWGLINNRPFLRCMSGFGLSLWRLGRFQEADRVFERMLWLNPSDNQGARFLIRDVRAGRPWRPDGNRR
jgi:tetratricopeptide (TPR) repeat protein